MVCVMQHDAPHASSRDQRAKSTPVPFAVLSQSQASQPAGCCLFYVKLTERFTCSGRVTVGPPAKLPSGATPTQQRPRNIQNAPATP